MSLEKFNSMKEIYRKTVAWSSRYWLGLEIFPGKFLKSLCFESFAYPRQLDISGIALKYRQPRNSFVRRLLVPKKVLGTRTVTLMAKKLKAFFG